MEVRGEMVAWWVRGESASSALIGGGLLVIGGVLEENPAQMSGGKVFRFSNAVLVGGGTDRAKTVDEAAWAVAHETVALVASVRESDTAVAQVVANGGDRLVVVAAWRSFGGTDTTMYD